jgi:hypothetical protein
MKVNHLISCAPNALPFSSKPAAEPVPRFYTMFLRRDCLLQRLVRQRYEDARHWLCRLAHGLVAEIPHSRRWRVSLAGRRTMTTAIKLREVAYPSLFAAAA